MKHSTARIVLVGLMATLAASVGSPPGVARAETVLLSTPVQGDGGVTCACVNLTKSALQVSFGLKEQGVLGGGGCSQTIEPGSFQRCVAGTSADTLFICEVRRADRKTVKSRDLACTMQARDAAGNTVAIVPLEHKRKR